MEEFFCLPKVFMATFTLSSQSAILYHSSDNAKMSIMENVVPFFSVLIEAGSIL